MFPFRKSSGVLLSLHRSSAILFSHKKKEKKNPTADSLSCGISSDLLSLYIYIPSGQSKRPGTCRANDPLVDVSSIDHMPLMSKNETKTSQSRVSL
jgi:hypothetical protein